MTITFGLLVLGAYLLGSVPAAYLVVKWSRGIDIRQYGSGNIGASNIIKTTSKKLGASVAMYDLFKGVAMVWVAQLLDMGITEQVAVGLAVIIGHNWPVFLRFNGGRGVITSIGVAFFLMPWGIIVFIVVALPTLILKASPLPVLAAIAALPLASWGLCQPMAVTMGLLAIFLILVIRRLTAPRAVMTGLSYREIFINRLLFDRDIRDGKAWENRKPSEASSTGQSTKQAEK